MTNSNSRSKDLRNELLVRASINPLTALQGMDDMIAMALCALVAGAIRCVAGGTVRFVKRDKIRAT